MSNSNINKRKQAGKSTYSSQRKKNYLERVLLMTKMLENPFEEYLMNVIDKEDLEFDYKELAEDEKAYKKQELKTYTHAEQAAEGAILAVFGNLNYKYINAAEFDNWYGPAIQFTNKLMSFVAYVMCELKDKPTGKTIRKGNKTYELDEMRHIFKLLKRNVMDESSYKDKKEIKKIASELDDFVDDIRNKFCHKNTLVGQTGGSFYTNKDKAYAKSEDISFAISQYKSTVKQLNDIFCRY